MKRWFSPAAGNTAIAASVVLPIAVLLYLFKFKGNITGFFRIGSVLPFSPYLNPETALIYQGELGYDGQQFLTLAFDPFLTHADTIAALDNPAFRYRRIFYPLLSHFLGLGNPQLIPYVMVGVNLLAILGLVWLISRYHCQENRPSAIALALLAIPGIWIVLAFSTADLLNSFFLISAFYCYTSKRPILTALAITIACFTRETSLIFAFSLGVISIWEKRPKQTTLILLSVLPALLWNGYLIFAFQSQGIPGASASFVYPFVGIFQKFAFLLNSGLTGKSLYDLYCFLLLLLVIILNLSLSVQTLDKNRLIFVATIFESLIVVMSSTAILDYFFNYPRTFLSLYLFLFLLQGSGKTRRIQWGMTGLLGASSLVFLLGHS
jgi:hypothetical protein